ncbi:hypothetical protein LTR17_011395 [Elasticomyces elasticus]|nr:hypothetical protein LTR17_011395 [Elasticomyces elasticus]
MASKRRKIKAHLRSGLDRAELTLAEQQMYKKRFSKWGTQKNSRRSTTSRPTSMTMEVSRKSSLSHSWCSVPISRQLSNNDSLVLLLLSSVQIWSASFYESVDSVSASIRQFPPELTEETNFTFKLVIDMLNSSQGNFAGRLARKAFMLLEGMVKLDGPALVWNMLEIIHHMISSTTATADQRAVDYQIASFEEDGMLQQRSALPVKTSPPRDYDKLRASNVGALRNHAEYILSRSATSPGDAATLLHILAGLVTAKVLGEWPAATNQSETGIEDINGLCLVFNDIPEATVKSPWQHVLGTAVKTLDLVGFALISSATIMLLLALQCGGNQYVWGSSVVIGLLSGAAAVFVLFLFWEHRQGDGAMIPFAFLRSPIVRSASLTQFLALGGILIGDFYLAIFFQVVRNDSPLMSGVHLLPVALGLVIFTLATGGLIQATGYYLLWILAGSAIATVSYGFMSTLSPATTFGQWFGYLCLYGIGSGVGNSGAYIAVQSLVPLRQIPTAIAIIIFAQNLGAAIWVVVANAIFNNSLRKELAQRVALIGASPDVIMEAGARNIRTVGLDPSQLAAVLVAYSKAIDRTMYLGVAVFGSVMLVAWEMGFENLKEVGRQKELKKDSTPEERANAPSDVKPVEQRPCYNAVNSNSHNSAEKHSGLSAQRDGDRRAFFRALIGGQQQQYQPATPLSKMEGSELEVGDAVTVLGDLYGMVRFIGSVKDKAEDFVGVELDRRSAVLMRYRISDFHTIVCGTSNFLPLHREEKRETPTASNDYLPATPGMPSHSSNLNSKAA